MKAALIVGVTNARNLGTQTKLKYLESQGVKSSAWFDRMQRSFLRDHPDFDPSAGAVPAVKMKAEMAAVKQASGFRGLSDAEKRKLIAEYDSMDRDGKAALLRRLNVSQSAVSFQRMRLIKKEPPAAPGPPKMYSSIAEAVADYDAMPRGGKGKSVWLREHDLNHQQIWEMKHNNHTPHSFKKFLMTNGSAKAAAEANRAALQSALVPAVRRKVEHELIEPLQIPVQAPTHVVSLDDAITAMEVRRDLLDEFIGNLKRMRAGAAR